ncbi:unnamed protein product [Chrysoparadoxa australica]
MQAENLLATLATSLGREKSALIHCFDHISVQFALHYACSSEQKLKHVLTTCAEALHEDGSILITLPDCTALAARAKAALSEEPAPDQDVTFGNDVFQVTFTSEMAARIPNIESDPFGIEYTFTLGDAVVECPEYLVPLDALAAVASSLGMKLTHVNFGEFVQGTLEDSSGFGEGITSLQALRVVEPGRQRVVTDPEWEAVCLYTAVILSRETK